MRTIATTDFSFLSKLFLYPITTIFALLALWDGYSSFQTNVKSQLYFIDIPLFVGCIAGLIYLIRHKLLLTEFDLWQYGFITKRIQLHTIDGIVEHLGSYNITAGRTSIRITSDLQQKDLFKAKLVKRIQEIDLAQNVLPGWQLNAEQQAKLLEQVYHMIDKGRQNDTLYEADTSIFDELTDTSYYLIYEYPIHTFLHRAYQTDLPLLKNLLATRINENQNSSLDIAILPLDLEWLIGCNHEGTILFQRD